MVWKDVQTMEGQVFARLVRRRFILKSRKRLKEVYDSASIIYGPKRYYTIKDFDPKKRYSHRALASAFERGKRHVLEK